ncbi:MAG: alpha/beta hydrolase domain-containing protein [Halioglobus sp.]
MQTLSTRLIITCFSLLVSLSLFGCSDGSDSGSGALPIANPTVTLPPDEGSINLLAQNFDLGSVGYEQAEYFLEGTATSFRNVNEFSSDGMWQAEPGEQATYRTRIVVYRPVDPADFNGTVLVEWLNVTAGFETPPSWGTGHLEMRRGGSVWVGVSAQLIGIEGADRGLLPLHLKAVDPVRYGSLSHPGDSFSYDIFSQVAQAIRNPVDIDPLDGLDANYLIAYGESQSAGRLVTYINALHPLYETFDGYMVHSRGDGSSSLAQDPLTPVPTPESARIRTDLDVPVMTFETETDVVGLGFASARQPDTDLIRTWEVAGTAHGDYYTFVSGRDDAVGDPMFASVIEEPSILGFITCDKPMNNGPHHYIFNTAVRALNAWVAGGPPPPTSPLLLLNDDGSDYQYDENRNALGGIRTPYVDTPSAVLRGEENTGNGFCRLFGTTRLFSAEEMVSLYVDQAGYVEAVTAATNAAVDAGFLLQEDADAIITWAPQQWLSQVAPE